MLFEDLAVNTCFQKCVDRDLPVARSPVYSPEVSSPEHGEYGLLPLASTR